MATYSQTPDWSGAVSALRQSSSVLIIAHVTPDADALGSALALGLALESLGKSVQVSVGEPGFKVPASLDFLPGQHLVVSPEQIATPEIVVSCDTSSDARLGLLADVLNAAPISIAIDHHASFTGFGTIHLIDPVAPATAALALELIDRLEVSLTTDIASAIYSGLATDTGSFKFQGTTADTLRIAARLYDAGIDHSTLARLLFDDEPFAALVMMGNAVRNAVLDRVAVNGMGLVYTSIAVADRGDLPELAMERVIEAMRRTNEAEVAAVFKQDDDGIWKGSLRSKTAINVGEVAAALGGGGHHYAAGWTATQDLDAAIANLKTELEFAARG